MSSERDRLASIVCDYTNDDAYMIADALLAAGVTIPAPKRQPERCTGPSGFGGIRCTKDVDHEGECW